MSLLRLNLSQGQARFDTVLSFLWLQDVVPLLQSLGLHDLSLLNHSRVLTSLAAVGVCSRAEGVRKEGGHAVSQATPQPHAVAAAHPPLLQRASPPIGLSHIRQWLAAKPHNPQRHKPSTMCLNKRAAVAAVPRGCGARKSFFRCWGPFIKTSVHFGSKNKPVFTSIHCTRKGLSHPMLWTAMDVQGLVSRTQRDLSAHPRAYPYPVHGVQAAMLNSR